MNFVRSTLVPLGLVLLSSSSLNAEIRDVRANRPFFDPTFGQKISVSFTSTLAGTATVEVRDRDGFLIRALAKLPVKKGASATFSWDGRDEKGRIVPNEAYFPRIVVAGQGKASTFDPREQEPAKPEAVPATSYSPIDGAVTYSLKKASRIHMQIGQAVADEKGAPRGPVLRTLADREPRAAGLVYETWNGRDESGSIDISSAPNLRIGILAVALPEPSFIAVGNRKQSFVEYALANRPPGATKVRVHADSHQGHGDHSQHAGLNALEDGAPALALEVQGARMVGGRLEIEAGRAVVVATLKGPRTPYFASQPTAPRVFVNEKQITGHMATSTTERLEVDLSGLSGPQRIAVNWASRFGPVAIGSVEVDVVARPRAAEMDSPKE